MKFTVENICGLLIGSKLLAPDEVKAIYQRWQAEARECAADLAQFTRWLVAKQYLTEYQVALVAKGYTDGFFIHHYKILERLGKDRTARVYKAVHQLGHVVAIKVLPPSRGKDAQMLARFKQEARMAVRLRHPNVVRSFQIGEFDGLHYLVMEHLDGETLEAVLQRRKKLPANEAARLIYQALQGLEHIHDQGMVHRDLKPANLMLTPASSSTGADTTLDATLKILDIGLGRVPNDAGNAPERLTAEGALLGTPDYLAPEQARDPRTTDIRADIYSLGCVLYHTLTGQPPFPDTNVLSQMIRHASEAPRPLDQLAPGVPHGLQQVLNVMLAKDPAQRFTTPERAARALHPFIAGGAPPQSAADSPQLKKYLTWLTMNADEGEVEAAVPAPPLALPANPEPASPGAVAAAAPVTPQVAEFDAELLPPARTPSWGLLPVTNSDWYFLGLGAAGVIVAGLIGFGLAWMLRG